jgi:hypothetical protein
MVYSEFLPTRLNPLAERTCFSQALTEAERHDEIAAGESTLIGGTTPSARIEPVCEPPSPQLHQPY